MIPYFILLALVMFFTFAAKKAKKNKILFFFNILIVFLLLVLFAGLRDVSVGTDTSHYVYYFQLDRIVTEGFFTFKSSLEPGYEVLQKTARIFTDEYWILLTFIAIVIMFFYLKTILSLSENYIVSIFLFITLGIYLFFFNGARQGIAVAIFSFSLIAVIKEDYKKYYFWIFVGFLFHKSILMTLPFYYLLRKKYSLKNVLILLSVLFVMIFFSTALLAFLPDETSSKYSQYINTNYRGGLLMTVFYSLLLPFFIFMRRYVPNSQRSVYDIYLNIATIFTFIYVIVAILGLDVNFLRLSLYFSLGMVLLWPIIFKNINKNIRPFVYLFFMIGHMIFFYSYLDKIGNLNPYIFNFGGLKL